MAECLVVPMTSLEGLSFWPSLPRENGKLCAAVPLDVGQRAEFIELVNREKEFRERKGDDGIEKKPEWQQPIFYGIVTRGEKFFAYKRGDSNSKYSEGRLASKISIGLGGHIEPYDSSLESSLNRELSEEVVFRRKGEEILVDDAGEMEILGLVKNETDDVGKVHVGLICRFDLRDEDIDILIRDAGKENQTGWMLTMAEYDDRVNSGEFEPEEWTRLILKNMGDLIIRGKT